MCRPAWGTERRPMTLLMGGTLVADWRPPFPNRVAHWAMWHGTTCGRLHGPGLVTRRIRVLASFLPRRLFARAGERKKQRHMPRIRVACRKRRRERRRRRIPCLGSLCVRETGMDVRLAGTTLRCYARHFCAD